MDTKSKPAPTLNQAMCDAIDEMLADGTIEGLASRLRGTYPKIRFAVEDAIAHAVEKLIVQVQVRKPPQYLAACATNHMNGVARELARRRLISLDMLQDNPDTTFDLEDESWTVEESALVNAVYDEVTRHVETWEPGNVKVVTLLYLEAAYNGEPLTSEDAAQVVSEIIGEEVGSDFVRTWKSRGFRRLRKYAEEVQLNS